VGRCCFQLAEKHWGYFSVTEVRESPSGAIETITGGVSPAPTNPGENNRVAFASAGTLRYSAYVQIPLVGGELQVGTSSFEPAAVRLASELNVELITDDGAQLLLELDEARVTGDADGAAPTTRWFGDGADAVIESTLDGNQAVYWRSSAGVVSVGVFGVPDVVRQSSTTLIDLCEALKNYGWLTDGSNVITGLTNGEFLKLSGTQIVSAAVGGPARSFIDFSSTIYDFDNSTFADGEFLQLSGGNVTGNSQVFTFGGPQSVTGSRSGGAALTNLLVELASIGLIINNTTA